MSGAIPVVLCIDVEPDERFAAPGTPARWDGLPRTLALIDRARPSLRGMDGAPARVNWFVRLDPQVQLTHGRADWVVDAHRASFDGIDAAGDDLGLHVHPRRWDASAGTWITDYSDPAWLDACLDMSFDEFLRAFGRPCRSFRFGDRWMDQRTMRSLEARGVEVDLTVEPGFDSDSFYGADDPVRGVIPDYRPVPSELYRPHTADFRTADHSRDHGIWILPVTTALVRTSWLRRVYRRYVRRLPTPPVTTGLASLEPGLFARVIDAALRRPNPSLVLSLHTGAAVVSRYAGRIEANLATLARHAEAPRMVWVRPREAVRLLGG